MTRWLSIALVATSLQTFACEKPRNPGDRALIVGISNYDSGDTLRLAGPTEDRRAIRELLQTKLGFSPDSICELADTQATEANIRAAFEDWLIFGTGKGDRVFFYFSGHGGTKSLSDDLDNEHDGLDELLIAADVVMDGQSPKRGYVADNQIKLWLDRLTDRQTTLVIDSCYAGTIYRSLSLPTHHALTRSISLKPSPDAPKVLARSALESGMFATLTRSGNPGLTVWMASSEGEMAFDAPKDSPRYGQFTRAWINQVNANVSLSEAIDALRMEAKRYCASLGQSLCASLTPQLHTDVLNKSRTVLESIYVRPRLVPEAIQASIASLPNSTIAINALLRVVANGKLLNEYTNGYVGSTARLEVTSDGAGYLHRYVLQSGGLKRLCLLNASNEVQCAPKIAAGETRREQIKLTASGPALLMIVVTERPFSDQTEQKTRGINITMEDGSSTQTDASDSSESQSQIAIAALAQELLQQASSQSSSASSRFGVATVRFHIEE